MTKEVGKIQVPTLRYGLCVEGDCRLLKNPLYYNQ